MLPETTEPLAVTTAESVNYTQYSGRQVRDDHELVAEMSSLYSDHYGVWGLHHPKAGQQIKLSPARLDRWLDDDAISVGLARSGAVLVGYAIAARVERFDGPITWVTQLVVHQSFRRRGVATNLLFSRWSFSDDFGWGIVTANPYAVRALEKATRRRVEPRFIMKHVETLKHVAEGHIPYMDASTPMKLDEEQSLVDTEFRVDHKEVPGSIQRVTQDGTPWMLGLLPEGWEWLAFAFSEQEQTNLTSAELEDMLSATDDVVRQAYSRMTLDGSHVWAEYTAAEVDFVIDRCGLERGQRVLDIGCGNGRHALELARRGFIVTGIDYAPGLIKNAKGAAFAEGLHLADFLREDARGYRSDQEFDAVLCLYDVIGSFAEEGENRKILKTVCENLRPGGKAVISVMNRALTESAAKHYFSLSNEPSRLLELQPSNTMETTGNVFDPDYYMIDTDSGVVYRKEQFSQGELLQAELLVRDRRYSEKEISEEINRVGLRVDSSRCVRLGHWDAALDATHKSAKEVLVLCSKPQDRGQGLLQKWAKLRSWFSRTE